MPEYSLSLDGMEWKDNKRLVDWQCKRCSALFATREDVLAHVRAEHNGGTYGPRLNAQGAKMVVAALMASKSEDPLRLAFLRDSGVIPRSAFVGPVSEDRALKILRDYEPEILSQMGMKAGILAPDDTLPETSKSMVNPPPSGQPHCLDVLLVTATKVETYAVLNAVKKLHDVEPKSVHIGSNTYRDLKKLGGARTYMVRCGQGSGGTHGSALTLADAIGDLKPSAIVMVGTAFGIDPKKQHIGTVLVSRQIFDYAPQRVGTGDEGGKSVIPRGDRVSASPKLLAKFENSEYDWDAANVQFGLLLSGPNLVDNLEYREELRQREPEAIGGEMEGAGLYAVAERNKVDWIIVKAVSDWADGKKHVKKQERRMIAAENAARFTVHVMEQGGFASNMPETATGQPETLIGSTLPLEQKRLLQVVHDDITNHPQRGYALIDGVARARLGLDGRAYVRTAQALIKLGFLEEVLEDTIGHIVNIRYAHLRLTPEGRSLCLSVHTSPSIQSEPGQDVKAVLEKWEGKRIKLRAKDDQYLVHRGKLHHLYEDAAMLCDDIGWRWNELRAEEEAILFESASHGSNLDETLMPTIVAEILSNLPEFAHEKLIILSARWGAGDVWDLVTATVSSKVTPEGTLEMLAHRDVLGDPCYGVEKTLKALYVHAGRGGKKTVPEGAWLRLP
jgi:nucleoside phosphorylase